MSTQIVIQTVLFLSILILHFFFTLFWLIHIFKDLRKTSQELNLCKKSHIYIDSQVKSKLIFNYRTVYIKDVLLICIAVLEFILPLCLIVAGSFQNYYKKTRMDIFKRSYNDCDTTGYLSLLLINPFIQLLTVGFAFLFISSMMLLVILTTYLSRRYFGYTLEIRFLVRIIVWWTVQTTFLLLSVIPQLEFLIISMPIFLSIDWVLLSVTSWRLSQTLKSKLLELFRFEYDPVRYRSQKIRYKAYNVFVTIHTITVLTLILVTWLQLVINLTKATLFNDCYLKYRYHIHMEIHVGIESKRIISEIIEVFSYYVNFSLLFLYGIFLDIPFSLLFLAKLSYFLFKGSRNSMYRYNYSITQPLLS